MKCLPYAPWRKISIYLAILFFMPMFGAKGKSANQSGGEFNIRLLQDTKEDAGCNDNKGAKMRIDTQTEFKKGGLSGKAEEKLFVTDGTKKNIDIALRKTHIKTELDLWERRLGKQKSGVQRENVIQSGGEFNIRLLQDTKEDTAYEDHEEARARLNMWTKFKKGGFKVYISGRTEGEWFIGDDTQKDVDVTLQQAYIKTESNRWELSLGKQIVTWGKLDDIIVIDGINPQDFRWFVTDKKQERKEPIWMLQTHYFGDNYDVELLYMPFFRASRIDFFGSDWAVFDHLKETVVKGSYPAAAKNVIRGVKIKEEDKLGQYTFDNGDLGLRFRSAIANIDCAFYYMYIHSRIPGLREKTPKGNILKKFLYTPSMGNLNELLALSPTNKDLTLEKEYPRMNVIGGDFETVIGEYGLRGEYGLFLNAPYLRSDFSFVKKDRLSLGIGIDHTTSQNWYYNLQFIEDIILNYEELFAQEEYTHQITLNLKKDFLRGNLIFALDYAYNLSLGDSMFNPQLQYEFNGGIEAALGGFIFEGDSTTLFGRYDNKDLVYMEMNYKF